MNIEKIEAALTVAENYVIRATFDSAGVGSAIATLEIARDIAMNNAPIWFAGGNIAQWKLCVDNARQFSAAIGLLKADSTIDSEFGAAE